jgi:hypothetical protein
MKERELPFISVPRSKMQEIVERAVFQFPSNLKSAKAHILEFQTLSYWRFMISGKLLDR